MKNSQPCLIALDFDGVVCNGLQEYFVTAWSACRQIWLEIESEPPIGLAETFYRLRPVIETGWEMPVLLRVLLAGITEEQIWQDWQAIAHNFIKEEKLVINDIGQIVDQVRDEWINRDFNDWLSLHHFYPGMLEKLTSLLSDDQIRVVIITTKEGRFVRSLLQMAGVNFPADRIFGKEIKQPKYQTLQQLLTDMESSGEIWFIEDRLKTLLSVGEQAKFNPELKQVKLFLADWGYNTEAERAMAANNSLIDLLSLQKFTKIPHG